MQMQINFIYIGQGSPNVLGHKPMFAKKFFSDPHLSESIFLKMQVKYKSKINKTTGSYVHSDPLNVTSQT